MVELYRKESGCNIKHQAIQSPGLVCNVTPRYGWYIRLIKFCGLENINMRVGLPIRRGARAFVCFTNAAPMLDFFLCAFKLFVFTPASFSIVLE